MKNIIAVVISVVIISIFTAPAFATATLIHKSELVIRVGYVDRVLLLPQFGAGAAVLDFVVEGDEPLTGVTPIEGNLYQMRYREVPQWVRDLQPGDTLLVVTHKGRLLRIEKTEVK